MLEQDFQRAVDYVNHLTYTPEKEVLGELYGYYKQATEGDNETEKPSWFDLKGTAKWQAWMKMYGMPRSTAMNKYIALAKTL